MIALSGFNSYSQTENTPTTVDHRDHLLFGVKLGLNYSNVYDAQGDNFVADAKFGVALGGFVSIPIGSFIGVQPELLYSQKGYKSSGTFLGTSYSMTRTTDFLDIPIYFVVKPVENISLLYDEATREAILRHLFNSEMTTRIIPPQLGDSAGVFGAALLTA